MLSSEGGFQFITLGRLLSSSLPRFRLHEIVAAAAAARVILVALVDHQFVVGARFRVHQVRTLVASVTIVTLVASVASEAVLLRLALDEDGADGGALAGREGDVTANAGNGLFGGESERRRRVRGHGLGGLSGRRGTPGNNDRCDYRQ